MHKHLVLVGGGHAHLAVLKQTDRFCQRGHRVTLVSPSPFHDYSALGPALLSGKSRLTDGRFNIGRMVTTRGGTFIEATATGIDPVHRKLFLDNGETIDYDLLSCNSGSSVDLSLPAGALGETIFPAKPVANLFHARQKILAAARTGGRPLRLLVVGGGPAGCEIAGNLQELRKREKMHAEITLVTSAGLLDHFPGRVQRMARSLLVREELRLIEGMPVKTLAREQAELLDGRTLPFDFAFVAVGIAATGPFADKPLCEEHGSELLVNEYLQSPAFAEIFGGGDCISYQPAPLDKVGVHAVRQSRVLADNLLAALEQGRLQQFRPQKKYLLIFNLGLGRAIACGYGLSWSGRTALWLKHRLDRRFLLRFQESA